MSFNETIPLQIWDLEKRISSNGNKMHELNRKIDESHHECDCEYCEIYADILFEEDEAAIIKSIAKLEEENQLIELTIKRLKVYASDRNITLKAKERNEN
jgi:hypothetical protein